MAGSRRVTRRTASGTRSESMSEATTAEAATAAAAAAAAAVAAGLEATSRGAPPACEVTPVRGGRGVTLVEVEEEVVVTTTEYIVKTPQPLLENHAEGEAGHTAAEEEEEGDQDTTHRTRRGWQAARSSVMRLATTVIQMLFGLLHTVYTAVHHTLHALVRAPVVATSCVMRHLLRGTRVIASVVMSGLHSLWHVVAMILHAVASFLHANQLLLGLTLASIAVLLAVLNGRAAQRSPVALLSKEGAELPDALKALYDYVEALESKFGAQTADLQTKLAEVAAQRKASEYAIMNRFASVESGIDVRLGKESVKMQQRFEEIMARLGGMEHALKQSLTDGALHGEVGRANPALNALSDVVDSVSEELTRRAGTDGSSLLTKEAALELISAELDKFAADGTGRADFALYSGGGRVIAHSALHPSFMKDDSLVTLIKSVPGYLFKASSVHVHPEADKRLLLPGAELPGDCLPLNGSNGYVDVSLREHIIPDAVTIQHIPQEIAYDVRSAPRSVAIYAWSSKDPTEMHHFCGDFQYSVAGRPAQLFSLQKPPQACNRVRFHILSNHGHPNYTCLYRIRVHGEPLPPTEPF